MRFVNQLTDPQISVIVPIRDRNDLTDQFLSSLFNTTRVDHEVILVNSGLIKWAPRVAWGNGIRQIVKAINLLNTDPPLSIYAKWNIGCREAVSDYLAVFNNDVLFGMRCLEFLREPIRREQVWATYCCPVSNVDELKVLPMEANFTEAAVHGEAHLRGWGFMLSRQAYEAVGPFDEQFSWYYGDDDYGRRLQAAGHPAREVMQARAFHLEQATYKSFKSTEEAAFTARVDRDRFLFNVKWPKAS